MKKNLLALLVLLVLIAGTARYLRQPGEDPQLTSLRQDAAHCLNALGPSDVAQVELVSSLDGMILIANVHIPSEVSTMRKSWSFDVLGMVTRRHPQVRVVEVRVNDSGRALQRNLETMDLREVTLLRRQRQAEVDQLMPPGTALVLLDAEIVSTPSCKSEKNRSCDDGPSARKVSPNIGSLTPIRTTVGLVLTQDPPAGLLQQIKPDRVVRLPQP